MNIPAELDGILVRTDDTLSGAVRFAGTRVPVQALLDSSLAGESLNDFLDGYPGVTKEQAEAVLLWERNQVGALLGLD
jgi:uncharacterized protein (DUF433 family)